MPLKEDKFIKFFVDWINQATLSGKNPSTGEPIKSSTISLYTKTYYHFTDYLIDEWGDPEIGMLDLDPECIDGFRKYAKVTIHKTDASTFAKQYPLYEQCKRDGDLSFEFNETII